MSALKVKYVWLVGFVVSLLILVDVSLYNSSEYYFHKIRSTIISALAQDDHTHNHTSQTAAGANISSKTKTFTMRNVTNSSSNIQIISLLKECVNQSTTDSTNTSQSESEHKPILFEIDDITKQNIRNFSYSNFRHINKLNVNYYSNHDHDHDSQFRTFEDFNNELLCPLDLQFNAIKNNLSNLNNLTKAYQRIFSLQFPVNCNLNDRYPYTKFLILPPHSSGGLFATLRVWAFYFLYGWNDNRTVIFDGSPWGEWGHAKYCSNKSEECYFWPLTNCSINQSHIDYNLIQDAIEKEEYTSNFRNSSARVLQLKSSGYAKMSCNRKYRQIQVEKNFPGIACEQFVGIFFNFVLRIQPSLSVLIHNMVYDSLKDMPNIAKYNPQQTISAIIRWSDKCFNSEPTPKKAPEQECFTLPEYVNVTKQLKLLLADDVNYIIVTSESSKIIQNITNQSDDLSNMGINLIVNKHDIKQGGGAISGFNNDNVVSVMISMLSSIKLQFGGKYYFYVQSSSWVSSIFVLKKTFNCQPIYQVHINMLLKHGFAKLTSNIDDVEKTLSQLQLFSTKDRQRSWMYQIECISFVSQAFSRITFQRYIQMSQKLNQLRHEKFGNDTAMFDKFNVINYYNSSCNPLRLKNYI